MNVGDLDGAISQLRSATEQKADYAPAHFYLGQALVRKGLIEEANQEFAKASELDPQFKTATR